MNNAAAALALLATLTLGETAPVFGVQVTRASLFGFRVGREVLDAQDAAKRLAELTTRARGALAVASERCKALGIAGRFELAAFIGAGSCPVVQVTIRLARWSTGKRVDAVREVLIACRKAGLFADYSGGKVMVTE